ncbi:hypothetical protein C8Q80DRAFT_1111257 [Daedaleopsis nitida]|nr:hypothetical protein C8Q80DRAFT_1111257 [Daedaleopsis nitida]
MSPLVRAAPTTLRVALRRTPAGTVRTLYTNKPHVAYENLPFSYADKRKFGIKLVGLCGTFFLIPFMAVGYQLRKSAGGSN